jgi:hypothetical protein
MREICQSGFDERGQETGSRQTGLREHGESLVKHPPGGYRHCACSRLYSAISLKSERFLTSRFSAYLNTLQRLRWGGTLAYFPLDIGPFSE